MDKFALTLESDNDTGIFTVVQYNNIMLISIYLQLHSIYLQISNINFK